MIKFDDIFTYPHLYSSYKRCLIGKRYKNEVMEFGVNLSSNLTKLFYDLKYERYRISGYHEFKIYDPKVRIIQAISFNDRIVQHCLVDFCLYPLLTKSFIYDNVACQKGKGMRLALSRLRTFIISFLKNNDNNKGFFVKIDASKYFDSIDHDIIKSLFLRYNFDDKLKNLLFHIVDSYEKTSNKGIPMGNQTSQLIGLLYLNELDHLFKEKYKVKRYIRYMDDILMIVDNKNLAKEIIDVARDFFNKHLIAINEKSTSIIPFSNGITFLGWRIYLGTNNQLIQTIKKNTKQRIIKASKRKMNIDEPKDIIKSYDGFFSYGDTYLFKRKIMDKLIKMKSTNVL